MKPLNLLLIICCGGGKIMAFINIPDAQNILIFCDSGGANSYRHHAFKKKRLELATKIGRNFIICHYPPYASKWNPIEHKLFAQIHLAMEGAAFYDYFIIKSLIEKLTTKNGLRVIARIVDKKYLIGIKTPKSDIDFDRISLILLFLNYHTK